MGGHIHVGLATTLPAAVLATEVTLRVVTEHLDARRALIEDQDGDGDVDLFDFQRLLACTSGPGNATPPIGCSAAMFDIADLDDDEDVDLHDVKIFQLGVGPE